MTELDITAIHHRARVIWSMALSTPIIYLGAAWLAEGLGWVARESAKPYDTPATRSILVGLGIAALVVGCVFRWRRQARVQKLRNEPERALAGWRTDFFIVASMADLLGFLGLVGFIVTGLREAVFIGGAAAYLGYALAYPVKSELTGLSDE